MQKLKKRILLTIICVFISICLFTYESKAVRFAAFSDTHYPFPDHLLEFQEYIPAIIADNVDFVIVAGDIVDDFCETQAEFEAQLTDWLSIAQPLYDAGIGVYPIRGNHEVEGVLDINETKQAWDNVFSGSYASPDNGPVDEKNITYSFSYDNVLIIGLDVYGTHWHRVNQAWLDEQFSQNNLPHIFLYAHEPAFQYLHPDCLASYPAQRNTFWDSIAAASGRTYICGHDHAYDHARLDDGDGDPDNDLHQFMINGEDDGVIGSYIGDNGSWIPQCIYNDLKYGYLLIDVNGLDVTTTWKHRIDPNTYVDSNDVFNYQAKPVPPDFDADGYVNLNDLAFFVLQWLNTDCNDLAGDESDWCFGTDFDQSGIVNADDFREFAFYWLGRN
ncbi:MAG: metallophosphatase family protein [Sedimentisphaerales bacterium]|nr:metallophosphatase family protein [Sedimentisphaerales bacterium]